MVDLVGNALEDLAGNALFWFFAMYLMLMAVYKSWLHTGTRHLFEGDPKRKWVQFQLFVLTSFLVGVFAGAAFWISWSAVFWLIPFWLTGTFFASLLFRNYYHKNPTFLFEYRGPQYVPRLVSLFLEHDAFFDRPYWESSPNREALTRSVIQIFETEDEEQVRESLQKIAHDLEHPHPNQPYGKSSAEKDRESDSTTIELNKGKLRVSGWLYEHLFRTPLTISMDKNLQPLLSRYEPIRYLDPEYVIPDLLPYTRSKLVNGSIVALFLLISSLMMMAD